MSEEYSEIPMKSYSLKEDFIDAIEVTAQYVNSLPNAGAALARFGEQVEILNKGPVPKKIYAQVGEYIVRFPNDNGQDYYVIVSSAAFRALFCEVSVDKGEEQYADLQESADEEPEEEQKPLTRRQKRLQELKDIDIDSLEKPLETEQEGE